jgi:hypothetical protein
MARGSGRLRIWQVDRAACKADWAADRAAAFPHSSVSAAVPPTNIVSPAREYRCAVANVEPCTKWWRISIQVFVAAAMLLCERLGVIIRLPLAGPLKAVPLGIGVRLFPPSPDSVSLFRHIMPLACSLLDSAFDGGQAGELPSNRELGPTLLVGHRDLRERERIGQERPAQHQRFVSESADDEQVNRSKHAPAPVEQGHKAERMLGSLDPLLIPDRGTRLVDPFQQADESRVGQGRRV